MFIIYTIDTFVHSVHIWYQDEVFMINDTLYKTFDPQNLQMKDANIFLQSSLTSIDKSYQLTQTIVSVDSGRFSDILEMVLGTSSTAASSTTTSSTTA